MASQAEPALDRGSLGRSLWVVAQTLLVLAVTFVVAVKYPAAQYPLGLVWGAASLRSFMIFHDCGHNSRFPKHPVLNKIAHHLFAALIITPLDWGKGHALHHAHMGNLDQNEYKWCETVLQTVRQYQSLANWKQYLMRIVRHPVPFFLVGPLLVWWFRYRMPIDVMRKAGDKFSLNSKGLSTMWLFLIYSISHRYGVLAMVMIGHYLAMLTGIFIFHCQHVFPQGYARHQNDWNYKATGAEGSSWLLIPWWGRWATLGIEYHHIHHTITAIPGYALEAQHNVWARERPEELAKVPKIGWSAMWESFWLDLYDEDNDTYTRMAEVTTAAKVA